MPNRSWLLVLIVVSSLSARAQYNASDSAMLRSAFNQAISKYHEFMGEQALVYNGMEYPGYFFPFREGFPYFLNNDPNPGEVVYDGVLYPDLKIQLDEISGALILHSRGRKIQLYKERVSEFAIGTHRFIHLRPDSSNPTIPPAGFYEQLYTGNTSLLKKETKEINEELRSSAEGVYRTVESKRVFFVKKGLLYSRVRTKNDLMKVVANKRKEVQDFMRKHPLRFRKQKEQALLQAITYYDSLTAL